MIDESARDPLSDAVKDGLREPVGEPVRQPVTNAVTHTRPRRGDSLMILTCDKHLFKVAGNWRATQDLPLPHSIGRSPG
jgi:hypothetical protein